MTETHQAIAAAKALYKHFIKIGRIKAAENLLIRFPECKDEPDKTDPESTEEEKKPKEEVKKDDKIRKR